MSRSEHFLGPWNKFLSNIQGQAGLFSRIIHLIAHTHRSTTHIKRHISLPWCHHFRTNFSFFDRLLPNHSWRRMASFSFCVCSCWDACKAIAVMSGNIKQPVCTSDINFRSYSNFNPSSFNAWVGLSTMSLFGKKDFWILNVPLFS